MSTTNTFCATCAQSHNALNGRYCRHMRQYVEHAMVPPCSNNEQSKTTRQ